MSEFVKTRAFVLKTYRYSETSLIAVFYTLVEGKIRCLAKGARRPKSPFSGKLEPLNELEAVYIRGRSELYTLKECSMAGSRLPIREDLDKLNTGLRILSLLDETQADSDPHPEVFRLVTECLDAAAELQNAPALLAYYQTKLFSASGYAPDYSKCGGCGSALRKEALYSGVMGALVCDTCGTQHGGARISGGTLEVLRRIQQSALNAALRIRFSARQRRETEKLFSAMYETMYERRSGSGAILDSMGPN
jgi:DNA repair protein RecO (recombination protein O)